MMTKQEKKDVRTVLEYLWKDEKKHYQEFEYPPKTHIFPVLKRLAQKIEYRDEIKF